MCIRDRPSLEALVQFRVMIDPEVGRGFQSVAHVFRRGRQMRRHHGLAVLEDDLGGNRRLARRAVGDLLRRGAQPFGRGGESDELHRFILVRGALRHDEHFVFVDLAIPDDLERLAFVHRSGKDPAVIGGGHYNFAIRQKLRRLAARFPPDNVVLDGCLLYTSRCV